MRYLRMLSNSLVAGSMAAAYLVVLVLQLNPALPLFQGASWGLIATIWAGYGVNFSALFYALIVAQQLLVAEASSPGWFSVRLLGPFCASATVLAAALMWLNLRGLHAALDDEAVRRMTIGAAAMTAGGSAFVLVTILRYSIGPRGGRAGGITVLALMLVSIGAAGGHTRARHRAHARGTPPGDWRAGRRGDVTSARVVLIDIDGASLDFITPAAADGRLPNFERILDAGAALHLATLKPTQPAPVWTALATGKLPAHNGVRSAAIYGATAGHGATLDLLPDYCFAHGLVTVGSAVRDPADLRRAARAADLEHPRPVRLRHRRSIRWPLTWPAQPLLGALVTDQYHRASDLALAADEPGYTYPTRAGARSRRPRCWTSRRPRRRRCRVPTIPPRARWRSIGCTSRLPTGSNRAGRRRCWRCASRASTPPATTTCVRRCRARLATSATTSAGSTGRCSSSTTATWTR